MPSAIPVTMVCGPAASGKSQYVRDRAGGRDLVIDLDDGAGASALRPAFTIAR